MNSLLSESVTGSVVSELSTIRCKASSTSSSEWAFGVLWRSTLPREVCSQSLRGEITQHAQRHYAGQFALLHNHVVMLVRQQPFLGKSLHRHRLLRIASSGWRLGCCVGGPAGSGWIQAVFLKSRRVGVRSLSPIVQTIPILITVHVTPFGDRPGNAPMTGLAPEVHQ